MFSPESNMRIVFHTYGALDAAQKDKQASKQCKERASEYILSRAYAAMAEATVRAYCEIAEQTERTESKRQEERRVMRLNALKWGQGFAPKETDLSNPEESSDEQVYGISVPRLKEQLKSYSEGREDAVKEIVEYLLSEAEEFEEMGEAMAAMEWQHVAGHIRAVFR